MSERDPWKLALTTWRPGQAARRSGQYIAVDLSGKPYPDGGEITMVAGHPFPPTPGPGLVWSLVDATRWKHSAAADYAATADDAPDEDESDESD